MSAIAGILYFDDLPVEPGLIGAMTAAMSARGPDAQTHWMQGSISLGHCMLRTTAESLEEHQPVVSTDDNLVLVWDGRLDNRETLRGELVSGGVRLGNGSDAELALQSYAMWGEDCPGHLLGDFAFAVWDARRGKLFCARDQMGARPFYYTLNQRFFAFASEEEALLKLPGVTSRPNEERVAHWLVPEFQGFGHAHSWLEDVWALLAGQAMSVSRHREVRKTTYWQLEQAEETRFDSEQTCLDAFLEVFGEAVRCRMRTAGDVSAMISGGLDSASIAAMVRRVLPEMPGKAFHTYSAISDHPESCVESRCIQSLTRSGGANAHFVSVPSMSGMLDLQDLVGTAWNRVHPVDSSLLLQSMMCLAASRNGHRVMLHGVGGDLVTYAPFHYFAWQLRAGHWRRASREARAASRNHNFLRGTAPALLLLRSAWVAYVPRPARLLMRKLPGRQSKSPLAGKLINPDFAERLHLVERIREADRLLVNDEWNVQGQHLKRLSPPFGLTSGLSGYDRVAGRHGVELRDPWSDLRVVEFFLRLPLEYKVRDGWTKYIVRRAFAPDLAPEVTWRVGKEHLGWNFPYRLMSETGGLVERLFEQGLGVAGNYVDVQAARQVWKRFQETGDDADCDVIYEIISLAIWLERISDRLNPAM